MRFERPQRMFHVTLHISPDMEHGTLFHVKVNLRPEIGPFKGGLRTR
jgi:hypothetical protein